MIFLSILTVILFTICEGGNVIPPVVLTQLGKSYTIYIEDNITATECYISNEYHKYKIDLVSYGLKPEVVWKNSTNEPDNLMSLGNGICGVKVDNVSTSATLWWTLTTVDRDGHNLTYKSQVSIKETKSGKKRSEYAVGSQIIIYCALDEKRLDYCKIHRPSGETVLTDLQSCSYTLAISKPEDFGIWKCELGYDSGMLVSRIDYEVVAIEQDKLRTWQNETEQFLNLGCSVENSSTPASFCLMVRPDGEEIKLKPGLATERYTALYTDMEKFVCSMQIKKPLIPAEIGLWRCEQLFSRKSAIGGFITVGDDRKADTHTEIPKMYFAHVNTTLTMQCRVPYPTTYCYFRGPDGFIYPVEDLRAITLGLCKFIKPEIKLTDNGTWICGFAKETGTEDDTYEFQVYVPEVIPIKAERQAVDATYGSSIELKCSTRGLGDYPLQYCRFLSPDGHMYHIHNHAASERLSYSGRGLEYGDCGIKINSVKKSDQGTWSCITRIGKSFVEKEVYTNIHLTASEPALSIASVVGISVGVSIVIVGGVFLGFRKWRRARNLANQEVAFQRNSFERTSDSNVVFEASEDQRTHLQTD